MQLVLVSEETNNVVRSLLLETNNLKTTTAKCKLTSLVGFKIVEAAPSTSSNSNSSNSDFSVLLLLKNRFGVFNRIGDPKKTIAYNF